MRSPFFSTASEIIGEVCGEEGEAMGRIVVVQMLHHRKEECDSILWCRSFSEFVKNEKRSFSHRSEEESGACEILCEGRFSVANA